MRRKAAQTGAALPAAERWVALETLRKDAEGLDRLGALLIDEVFVRTGAAPVGLDNPRSGDVVVLLAPGVEFSDSETDIVGMPQQKGGHGYRSGTPALDACFMALGPGIAPARPATVLLLDVASSVARALGIGFKAGERLPESLLE